jgi:hypothetical protein
MLKSPLLAALLIASLIANVSLFLFPYQWDDQKSPPRENWSQQSNSDGAKTEAREPPAGIQIECDPACAAKRANEGRINPWWHYIEKIRDDPVAGFTGLLFVATLILAYIARRQVKDSRAVQRAHVFVLAPRGEFQKHNGMIIGLRVWVIWKNSGTTPATEVNGVLGVTWVPTIEQFEFGRVDEGVPQPFVLGPGAESTSAPLDIGGGHIMANIERRGLQFFWGIARYRDIFPGSPEHVFEFCFRVAIQGKLAPNTPDPSVGFITHTEHNRYYDEK